MNKLVMAMLFIVLSCAGLSCELPGWFAANMAPPEKVKAVYQVPSDKKILVFVDDLANPVGYAPVKRELADAINAQFAEHKIGKSTIPYDRVLDLMATDQKFNDLGVANVGRKLQADQVLYVEIKSFRLREDEGNPLWEGNLQVSVRWVDAWATQKDSARIWPRESTEMELPAVGIPAKEDTTGNYGAELARTMSLKMADRITKLFYDHEVPAMEVENQ